VLTCISHRKSDYRPEVLGRGDLASNRIASSASGLLAMTGTAVARYYSITNVEFVSAVAGSLWAKGYAHRH
jgi:hypothetical protein